QEHRCRDAPVRQRLRRDDRVARPRDVSPLLRRVDVHQTLEVCAIRIDEVRERRALRGRVPELVARLLALAPGPVDHRIDVARHGTSTLPTVIGDNTLLRELGVPVPPPDLTAELRAMLAGG